MATGGVIAVLGIAIAAIALLFTGHAVRTPDLVGPAQGSSAPATPSHSPSSTRWNDRRNAGCLPG